MGALAFAAGGYVLTLGPTAFASDDPGVRFLSLLAGICGMALIGCGLGIIGLAFGWIRRGR